VLSAAIFFAELKAWAKKGFSLQSLTQLVDNLAPNSYVKQNHLAAVLTFA
jgi:hypothetical protein